MKHSSVIRRAATGVWGSAVILGTALAFPAATHAQALFTNITSGYESLGITAGIGKAGTQGQLPKIIGSYIGGALGLLGVILVVLIIYAGFLWMTAEGNEEKVKKAKSILTNAIIGMILIFAAYAITQFVVSAISTASSAT